MPNRILVEMNPTPVPDNNISFSSGGQTSCEQLFEFILAISYPIKFSPVRVLRTQQLFVYYFKQFEAT